MASNGGLELTTDDKSSARLARTLARTHVAACVARLRVLLDDDDGRVALAAASQLLDRAVGKPVQSVDVVAVLDVAPRYDVTRLTPEQLSAIATAAQIAALGTDGS